MNSTAQFYSRPSYSGGFNFPVYSGSRRQAGGNALLGAVRRLVVPALKSTGKALGRSAMGMLADVAHDVLDGSNFKDSLQQRASQYAAKTAQSGLNAFASSAANALENGQAPMKRRAPSMGMVPKRRRRVEQPQSQSNRLGARQRRPLRRTTTSRRPTVGRHVTRQKFRVPKLNASRTLTRRRGKRIPLRAGKLALKGLTKLF